MCVNPTWFRILTNYNVAKFDELLIDIVPTIDARARMKGVFTCARWLSLQIKKIL